MFTLKAQSVLLYLGIVSYALAIVEHLSNLGILSWLYSTIDKTTIFYFLIILGTAFTVTYLLELILRRKRLTIEFIRGRPPWARGGYDYVVHDYDVEWHLFIPPFSKRNDRPWADGPFCPKCKRELEEEKVGLISRKLQWFCPICHALFEMPKGDAKKMVEKNFAAYLRKKGEL